MLAAPERSLQRNRGGGTLAAARRVRIVHVQGFLDKAQALEVRGAELSHHEGGCTFETTPRRYDFDDPVLWRIGEVIHEAGGAPLHAGTV